MALLGNNAGGIFSLNIFSAPVLGTRPPAIFRPVYYRPEDLAVLKARELFPEPDDGSLGCVGCGFGRWGR